MIIHSKILIVEFCYLYKVTAFDPKSCTYTAQELIPTPGVTLSLHPLLYAHHDVWRIGCRRQLDKEEVEWHVDDLSKMNITTFLRDTDLAIAENQSGSVFNVKKSAALALERHYLEIRENAETMFQLGNKKKHIEKPNPMGFRNNVKYTDM